MKKNILIIILLVMLLIKYDDTNYFMVVTDKGEKYFRIEDNRVECLAELHYGDGRTDNIFSKDCLVVDREKFHELIKHYVWSEYNVIWLK